MTRINFLKKIALAVAASALIPKLILDFKTSDEDKWRPNPEWQTAEYGIHFYDCSPLIDERILARTK